MDLQTTPRVPAGALTSQLSRSIVARLQAHGPMTLAALRLALTGQHVSDTGLAKRLNKLQRVGHIERAPAQAGEPARWQATAVAQPAAPAPQPKPEIVPPRRVDVMSGTYVPTPAVLRAGALDYRKHPSVLLGERREYGVGKRETST